MSTAGHVVYSSSRSPISVSSSSLCASASSSVTSSPWSGGAALAHTSNGRVDSRSLKTDAAGVASRVYGSGAAHEFSIFRTAAATAGVSDGGHDGPYAFVYVTPSNTDQFLSLSSAAAFLESCLTSSTSPSHAVASDIHTDARVQAFAGDYWRLGYVVCAAPDSVDVQQEMRRRPFWCFTLEPLPEEQLVACRKVLTAAMSPESPFKPYTTATHGPSSPALRELSNCRHVHEHAHAHHQTLQSLQQGKPQRVHQHEHRLQSEIDAPLHDLLVTPLYVCFDAMAVVELPTTWTGITKTQALTQQPSTVLVLPRALTELSHCAAGWAVENLDGVLSVLVRTVPSVATLVYALRQRYLYNLPFLQLVGQPREEGIGTEEEEAYTWPSRNAAVDVYLTVGCTSGKQVRDLDVEEGTLKGLPVLPLADEAGNNREASQQWSVLTQRIRARCATTTQQHTVIFQGCKSTSTRLRRGVVAELVRSCAPLDAPSMSTRLLAALTILNALTPLTNTGHLNKKTGCAFKTDVLDIYVRRAGHVSPSALYDDTNAAAELRIVGGRVRRVVAAAAAYAVNGGSRSPFTSSQDDISLSSNLDVVPEPDVMRLLWFRSFAAGHEDSQGTKDTLQSDSSYSIAHQELPSALHVSQAELITSLKELCLSDELQAHIKDLTRAVCLLASLTFSTRHGTENTNEPALLAPASIPACEAASQLLHISSLELVQVLTTVETHCSNNSNIRSESTVRHALNYAGACQLQSVLVAHLGGVLVRTLLQAINYALQEGTELSTAYSYGSRNAASPLTTVSLVLNPNDIIPQNALQNEDRTVDSSSRINDDDVRAAAAGGGLDDWYAAFARLQVYYVLCARLVGGLQREARCEGVEREVDTWIDACCRNTNFTLYPTASSASDGAHVMAEVFDTAQRVSLSDTPTGFSSSSLIERIATVIESVVVRCGGGEGDTCAYTAAAVQHLLASALSELVESDTEEVDGDDNEHSSADFSVKSEVNETREKKTRHPHATNRTVLRWAFSQRTREESETGRSPDAAVAPHRRKTCLCIVPPCGLHPPLYLSLRRLAEDILTSVRLSKIGSTAAVRRVVAAVTMRNASFLPKLSPVLPNISKNPQFLKGKEEELNPVEGAEKGSCPFSLKQVLLDVLSLHGPLTDNTASTLLSEDSASLSLTVVEVIPITTNQARKAASITRFPFLQPIEPAATTLTPSTMDDAVLTYLQHLQPLWLALFFWSRMCHTVVCPVVEFGREWAAPLLSAYALRPSEERITQAKSRVESPFSFPREKMQESAPQQSLQFFGGALAEGEKAHLLKRVYALRSEARYRALTLLALTTVPLCRSAVLGVSCVFLSAQVAEEMTSCRAELRDAAVRCAQRVGRGWRARKEIAEVARRTKASANLAAASDGTCISSLRLLTPAELQVREIMEQGREDALKNTASLRTGALRTSADHLRNAVSALQHSWTTTLELLESELAGATDEINSFETQRRAAEDAARQEARMRARVAEEAYAEVWSKAEQRRQHRSAVQLAEQRAHLRHRTTMPPDEINAEALLREEERRAKILTRRLAELRRNAANAAEAALLARVVAGNQREDARWLTRHIIRQEQRLKREAQLRQQNHLQQQRSSSQEYALPEMVTPYFSTRIPEHNATTPVRSSTAAHHSSPIVQYSDAQGLVFTRPRPISHEAARRSAPLEQTRAFSLRNELNGGGHVSIASIDRTTGRNLAQSMEDDEDWEVQRDLMSLWESSRLTN